MIDRNRCVVVIPVYKKLEDYNQNEQQAFKQILKVFGNSRDIILLCPEDLVDNYKPFNRFILERSYFTYSGYNRLCKREFLYQFFLDQGYRYMCLTQLDIWVFQDNLEYFLNIFDRDQLDYIGAPWYGVKFCKDGTVGNGGFCIRRLETFRNICRDFPEGSGNEDVFFIFRHKDKLKIAPESLALEFSWEEKPYYAFQLAQGRLPMGTHAYASTPDRIGFWKHFIPGIREIKCKAGNPATYSNPNHKVGENDR